MKRLLPARAYYMAIIAVCLFLSCKQKPTFHKGAWEGTLETGDIKLMVYFSLGESASTISVPSQGNFAHPVSAVIDSKDSVVLNFNDELLRAQFSGKSYGDSVVGVWRQGKAILPLTIHRISASAIGHANIEVFLHECQQYALYRDAVNWNIIRDSAYLISGKEPGLHQLGKAVKYIFGSMHDNHAFWIYNGKYPAASGENVPSEISAALMTAVKTYGRQLQVIALDNNIGYIRMPMITEIDPDKIAAIKQNMKTAISKLTAQHIQKWVLDLRVCGGGNMWPMLDGISDILEDGALGGYTDRQGQFMKHWNMRKGIACQEDSAMDLATSVHNKVAVLIGPVTASAGEAVTTALRGRPLTRSFGTPSFGQITATRVFSMAQQGMMIFSVGYYTDRNKTVYKERIIPDEIVSAESNFENPASDPTVVRATTWLNK